jgi:retron-type reverse transcriptase
MPRRHDGLFDRIASFAPLVRAARQAIRGKRGKPGAAAFMANLETECLRLERELRGGAWRPGGYFTFRVRDPKPRVISAAPFRDRVVQHGLCAVIQPLFERGFTDDSFANRKGKGTHAALARYERYRDRHPLVLRADVYRFFPAIDHEILKRDLRRRLACGRTLALCDAIIDGSNPQERVDAHFPGDDLLTPLARRRGLPIGNLTSQLFQNVYLDPLDHFVREVLRAKGYVRYVDDFALFGDSLPELEVSRLHVERFLEGRRLMLHPDKTRVVASAEPAEFLGYVTAPGRRSLPEDGVRRMRNRLRGLRDRWRAGSIRREEVEARIRAWIAHAEHAQTWRLRRAIFAGGWFDPAAKPGRPPVPARGARRLLEQRSEERPLGDPQQERAREPEQQSGLPGLQHASRPEPAGSRARRACG